MKEQNKLNDAELVKYAQLDLLLELKRICNKYKIQYFLDYGSLLGTIRHHGYIPWDDDIDVGMLREDYEFFREVCKEELGLLSYYSLYDWNNDKDSPLPFMKLKINGTHYVESLANKDKTNNGIFIDIFPYDHAPDNHFLQVKQGFLNFFYRKMLLLKCGYSIDDGKRGIKNVLYKLLKIVSSLKSVDSWKRLQRTNAIKYNDVVTEHVVSLGGGYKYEKELRKYSWLCCLVEKKFENFFFYVPRDYDAILHRLYGDYLRVPSPENRINKHGIQYIDFGDYKIQSLSRK